MPLQESRSNRARRDGEDRETTANSMVNLEPGAPVTTPHQVRREVDGRSGGGAAGHDVGVARRRRNRWCHIRALHLVLFGCPNGSAGEAFLRSAGGYARVTRMTSHEPLTPNARPPATSAR